MNVGTLNSIALNATVAGGAATRTKTVGIGARWVSVVTKSTSISAIWQATQTKTVSIGALWQGGSTKFVAIGAYWAIPFHDQAPWGQMVGNNLVRPLDPNRIATWSTYSRPSSPMDGQTGRNVQTGKIETWDEKNNTWKDAAGNSL
jgi:hypothetical protein